MPFSLANLIASILPSMPRPPNPGATRIPSTFFSRFFAVEAVICSE